MMRRVSLFTVSFVLTAVVVCSLLLVPARAADPRRAIPSFARIVFEGGNSERFFAVFPSLGNSEADFSKHWNQIVQGSEEHALMAASFESAGRESLVLVSKLSGWDALKLRWRMILFPPNGVSAARPYAVWPVWRLETPLRMRVRFSVTEGLLICSISPDSHDIYNILNALDGRAESQATRRGR
jgi:hypothetical protein